MGSEKGEARYKKGHKSHFECKKVDEDLFYACLDLFLLDRISLESACIITGLSRPTLTKRWNAVVREEEVPGYWFGSASDEHEEIRRQILQKSDAMARNLRLGKTVRIRRIIKRKRAKVLIDYLTGDERREFNNRDE